ncbi:MAG: beta-ketoacyl synthase chain length factor [Deltaproteobacteria bacterium]|nr:beta-ketoacyl synthase chain length factor [Deltaproteobacteria bacterium]
MSSEVSFSIGAHAAWAPGLESPAAWQAWAKGAVEIASAGEPPLKAMPAMLRRRAGTLAKMALEVAYRCLDERRDVPIVFCSRHGEAERSATMLADLAKDQPLSPTSFALSVHNAVGGLFSMARRDRANHIAMAAGQSSVEHGVIEACGLLADGEPAVLLVVYDCPLPAVYRSFHDCHEQPFAWAWLMEPAAANRITLAWAAAESAPADASALSGGLAVLRFYLLGDSRTERVCDGRRWLWSRDA